MATFKINEKYSATYTGPYKVAKGYAADGEIWKKTKSGEKPTGIKFSVTGTSAQNAVNKAQTEAMRVCPDE